ncbi:MAG TPA: methylated-DNA--[protein]-cysteine S-methyltransferase [Syntrophorhabdaceae bacterium]|jgi:methylated-DNA-[protein]-cysteine S-methyltransferase
MELRKCTIFTPLGEMRAAAEGDALVGLRFSGQKYDCNYGKEWSEEPDYPLFKALGTQLDAYFSGRPENFDIPLSLRGTPFQRAVWGLLRTIPAGKTSTYGALAIQLREQGRAAYPRAVGGAIGRNPLSLIVPCHRVIGSNGRLTGYAGGLDRKALLLDLEKGADPGMAYSPRGGQKT